MCTMNSIELKKNSVLILLVHLDRTTCIGIILGIGIIFGVLSMMTIPEIDSESQDPFSYQTMKTKLMNSEITRFDGNYP